MKHQIQINNTIGDVAYRQLLRGAIFKFRCPVNGENVYMKIGTKGINLRTGDEFSFDQDKIVVPLENGTIISITVGDCK